MKAVELMYPHVFHKWQQQRSGGLEAGEGHDDDAFDLMQRRLGRSGKTASQMHFEEIARIW